MRGSRARGPWRPFQLTHRRRAHTKVNSLQTGFLAYPRRNVAAVLEPPAWVVALEPPAWVVALEPLAWVVALEPLAWVVALERAAVLEPLVWAVALEPLACPFKFSLKTENK